ncbi:ATP-binding cassette domain-containing protein [Tuwongella immobilis]|uniref:Toxin secretion abc transporter atp-binding protein: Probable toxin secretion ABC transporter ATP-binding protein n=1 Tax=Tuwongella immobilis TaxID=692036 RepID=A0A6C2YI03_9BACT|nr:ABC transporter ATP-binding protein [Tuwongella immobilis]VIP00622.1 toxin secretion abc transporter atp-binding protein : Probable toxin secretion ABC transporter ATP-binding protein OS=Planctomyces maris DSM 8797 GN=PM8797T_20433 PE=4 SV=1 [Tuwongella immobilis]VTR96662.1 toxin secretion abc transporter atp-binding protein : Probable toxin secretion ABC transporter ATP-binding protein OS=Planctomyces maris DSM 8797 GN=PM8797T_20433 PE=4 SV=1 [Tuwongella immobilis]
MDSVALLARLCRVLELPVREADLERIWQRTFPTADVTEQNWADRLNAAGRALGFRVSPIRLPLADAVREAAPAFPLITRISTEEGPDWLVLLEGFGGTVEVIRSRSPQERETISVNELTALVGPGFATAPLLWQMAIPSQPMDNLRSANLDSHESGYAGEDVQEQSAHHVIEQYDPEHSNHHAHGNDHHGEPRPLSRIWQLLRLEMGDIFRIVLFAVGVGILSLATPIAIEALVNTVANGVVLQPVIVLSLVLLGCLMLAGMLRLLQVYIIECIQRRLFIRVAGDFAQRFPRVRLEVYETSFGPDLANRFFDVVKVQKAVATLLLDGVAIVVATVVGMSVLAFYHPYLIGFDIALLVGLGFLIFVLGRGGIRTGIAESQIKYDLAAWLEEPARLPRSFKTGHGENLAVVRANELAHAYVRARRRHFAIIFRQTWFAIGLQVVTSSTLLGLGGYLVIIQELTMGQLIAAELIISLIVSSFNKLGKYLETFYDLCVGVEKLGHIIDLPVENKGGRLLPMTSMGLEVQAVDLETRRHQHWTFRVKSNERLAIEMPDGVQPLGDWVIGWRLHRHGKLLLDGIDMQDLDPFSVRTQVAVVGNDSPVAGTVEENLRLGGVEATEEELLAALRAVGLGERFGNSSENLNMQLVPASNRLNPDEYTLLQLARALVSRPRLLVIDGALDRIAPRAAALVRGLLCDRKAPWTLILITARPELASWCDRKLVVDASTSVEG